MECVEVHLEHVIGPELCVAAVFAAHHARCFPVFKPGADKEGSIGIYQANLGPLVGRLSVSWLTLDEIRRRDGLGPYGFIQLAVQARFLVAMYSRNHSTVGRLAGWRSGSAEGGREQKNGGNYR
jgi:hypothetical protein